MKAILTLLFFGALLSAGPVNVTLKDAGNPVVSDGKDDVSPYTLSVNGMNVPALCVDNKDWSVVNSTWSAYLTPVGSSNLSNTYHPSEGQEYEEDAYLYTLITQPKADRIDLQHAAWDIINDSITSTSQLASLNLPTNELNYVKQALNDYKTSGLNFSLFDIVSSASDCYRDQEFIIGPNCDAPEPTTYALIGVGLLMAGASRARSRKQAVTENV